MSNKITTLLLRFCKQDSEFCVTRNTLATLSKKLGISETEVIHLALSRLIRGQLPSYAADDGPLSHAEMAALRARADAARPQGAVASRKSLFCDFNDIVEAAAGTDIQMVVTPPAHD